MDFERALAYWLQDQRITGKSADTTRTWRSYLRRFARFADPMTATHFDVRAWLDANGHWSPACHKSARNALGSFYRLMKSEGWVPRNPMKRVPDGPPVRRRLQPVVCEERLRSAVLTVDPQVRRMVALAGLCGLRRNEIAQVHSRDLSDGGLVVHGKGDKERWVPVPLWLLQELEDLPRGYVFPGRFVGHIHPATVQKKIRATTGMPPHALRRRFASRVYEQGHDLLALQELLGHSSPATTQIYVGISRDRLRRAAGNAA